MKKYLFFLLAFVFFSFTADQHKSTYTIPDYANSVIAIDYDLDGDMDLVTGHTKSFITNWGGSVILENINNQFFTIIDSNYVKYGLPTVVEANFNNNEYPDFFSRTATDTPDSSDFKIILDYGKYQYDSIKSFTLAYKKSGHYDTGDLNNDGNIDIVFASNNGQFWGVIYNDGNGNFSDPEYFDTPGAWPNSIDCGDINADGRADIVLCRQSVEVFFSTEEGFDKIVLEEGSSGKWGAKVIDFDLDGDKDVLTYGGWPGNQLFIYENINDTSLILNKEYYHQFQSDHFFITDFNNDHFPDVIFQSLDYSGYYIYYNQSDFILSDSQFVALPPINPKERWRNFYCADMDNNGYPDIVCVKTTEVIADNNLEIKYNNGEGNFVDNPISAINEKGIIQNTITAFPNPFSNQTHIKFSLNKPSSIVLQVFNLDGIVVFDKNGNYPAGKHQIKWDGKDIIGNNCPSGVYMASLIIDNKIQKHIKIIK